MRYRCFSTSTTVFLEMISGIRSAAVDDILCPSVTTRSRHFLFIFLLFVLPTPSAQSSVVLACFVVLDDEAKNDVQLCREGGGREWIGIMNEDLTPVVLGFDILLAWHIAHLVISHSLHSFTSVTMVGVEHEKVQSR